MDSSSKRKQGSRRATPGAETLEGRQLLSTTTTTTTAPATAAPATTPPAQVSTATPGDWGQGGFGGMRSSSRFGGMEMGMMAMSGMMGMGRGGREFGMMDMGRGHDAMGAGWISPPAGSTPATTTPAATSTTPATTSTSTSTTPATTPTAPPSFQAERTAMKAVRTEEQAIHDKSQVTPALEAALRNDLTAIRKAATTSPDPTTVMPLLSDIQSAGGLPSAAQLTTIQTDFTAAAAGEGVTNTTLVGQTFTDLNALIAATNITPADITTLTADLKAAGMPTNNPLPPNLGVNLDTLMLAVSPAYHAPATAASTTTSTSTSTS